MIDLTISVLNFHPSSLHFQLTVLVAGCAVLGFGVALEVAPAVIMVPGEGIIFAISRVFHRSFGVIKNLFDLTLMFTAAVLSILFFHRFQGIGIGTLISALLVGRFVHLTERYADLIRKVHQLIPDQPDGPTSEADRKILSETVH